MSYTYKLVESDFLIKAHNVEKAFEAAKKHLCDANARLVSEISDIDDAFQEAGFKLYHNDETEDVTEIDIFGCEICSIPNKFFEAIAEFVEPESFIEFKDDEDERYMVKFYQGKSELITGKVIYPDSTQLSYDRMDALLNAVVSHEFIARKSVDAAENLIRIGFTSEELIKSFDVDEDDVREATRRIEEG